MAPTDIAKHLRRLPFLPLRIHVSNGDVYEISEHWHTLLRQTELSIGFDPDENNIPRRSIYFDTRLITHIEPLPNGSNPRGNGRH